MRALLILTTAIAGLTGGAAAAAGPSVEVKDAVARVTVIPEDRSDIKVEFVTTNPRLPLEVRRLGDRVIVDGDLDWKVRGCTARVGKRSVMVRGVGDVGWDDMPRVVIRTPRDVVVQAGGAVYGSVGRSASLDLTNAGCGDWTIGNVAGKARITQAGSGDTLMGSAGEAKIRIAGSGDLKAVSIRSGLDLDIAGSGDGSIGAVSGSANVKIAGSGDVTIGQGAIDLLSVTVAGSGDVDFGGVAQSLKARIAGSGDVRARKVTGAVDKHVAGSGDVRIG